MGDRLEDRFHQRELELFAGVQSESNRISFCLTTPFTRRRQSFGLNRPLYTVGVQADCWVATCSHG
jgi:hypothetical protein